MIDLQNLFVGLVKNYRSLNLRFQPQFESMTQWTRAEISWFASLGESLGFFSILEKDVLDNGRPVDLAWVNPFTNEVVFHLERENDPKKIRETIEGKLLPIKGRSAIHCCGVFDEVEEADFLEIADFAKQAFHRKRSCRELLVVIYSHIPPKTSKKEGKVARFQEEWSVEAFHFQRKKLPKRLRASCTTDSNYYYTMQVIEPELPPPYRSMMRG